MDEIRAGRRNRKPIIGMIKNGETNFLLIQLVSYYFVVKNDEK